MIKKAIGVLGAILLFAVGTALLVGFVRGAEERAVADEQLVGVVVVDQPISEGQDPAPSVRSEQMPIRLVADDAVRPADSLDGLIALTDLVPGEQLLWSRLGEPEVLAEGLATRVEIPDGYTAVTIPVSAERAFGGLLQPGMTVAIVGSFSLQMADENGESSGTVEATSALVHKVLVVEVQNENPVAVPDPEPGVPQKTPSGKFLVTLAAPIAEVERIVFAAEWGTIWLAEQNDAADTDGSRIQTAESIFEQLTGEVTIEDRAPRFLPFSDDGTDDADDGAANDDSAAEVATPGDGNPKAEAAEASADAGDETDTSDEEASP